MTFPLLRLSENARQLVLRNMDMQTQITFSFISKRSKTLIKHLNIHVSEFELHSFHLRFFIKTRNPEYSCSVNIECRQGGHAGAYFICEDYHWCKAKYTMRDWLDHLLSVMNPKKIDKLGLSDSRFTLKLLAETLGEFKIVEGIIQPNFPETAIRDVLNSFPLIRLFVISRTFFADQEALKKLLVQNFDYLNIGYYCSFCSPEITLDHLLSINATSVYIAGCGPTSEDIRRFVKLWIQGGCNPRLKYLTLLYTNIKPRIRKEEILDGLQYREWKEHEKFGTLSRVRNGYEIQRKKDGARARLHFYHGPNRIDFFVCD